MKKKFNAIFSILLSLILICSLGFARAESNEYKKPENIVSETSKEGVKTKGVTFITHDVYFDGYCLTLSVTMKPNDDKYKIVNQVIGEEKFDANGDKNAENMLGAYCEFTIQDSEEKYLEHPIPIAERGEPNGNAYTKTLVANLDPNQNYKDIMCAVSYGVMESPGKLTEEEPSLYYVMIPIQKNVKTYDVPLDKLDKSLSYINRIFVSQSDEITSVFIYYTPQANAPIPFSFYTNDKYIGGPYGTTSEYVFFAFRDNAMQTIKLNDFTTNKTYSIDIKTGDCTLEK